MIDPNEEIGIEEEPDGERKGIGNLMRSWEFYLDETAVEQFVHVVEANDVVVDIATNLKEAVRVVEGEAVGADSEGAIQTENVSLVLSGVGVEVAGGEEFFRQEEENPGRVVHGGGILGGSWGKKEGERVEYRSRARDIKRGK